MFKFDVVTFFPRLFFIQLTQVFSGKIHVYDEKIFLLTIKMTMFIELVRLLIYQEELPPISLHDTSLG